MLVYVAGIGAKPAIGMSMSIVGATSLFGSYLHSRRGNFYWQAALYFGGAGVLGSLVGSSFTHLLSSARLVMLFAGLMFIVGFLMLFGHRPSRRTGPPTSLARFLITGFGVGMLSGFLGVGGGFLILPALVWFTGLEPRRAVGTSLAIIAANSATGLIGQMRYTHWDWGVTAQYVAISLGGMAIGVALAAHTPERLLRRVFGLLVLSIAVAMCFRIGAP
jgi:uncharacterized membrane protein YfcA